MLAQVTKSTRIGELIVYHYDFKFINIMEHSLLTAKNINCYVSDIGGCEVLSVCLLALF